MADSLALMVSSGTSEAISTALDVLGAAVAMEMESHLYLTGAAVAYFLSLASDASVTLNL